MNEESLNEMQEMRKKCSSFLKEVTAPIKKHHSDSFEKYIQEFIKFPGTVSVVSIFFTSSALVKNTDLAIFGTLLIVTSLIVALNIFRVQLNIDKGFYQRIVETEEPMTRFSKSLTIFSRDNQKHNEDRLILDYKSLQDSYDANLLDSKKEDFEKFNSAYFQMNTSFWLLVVGIGVSFLSVFIC